MQEVIADPAQVTPEWLTQVLREGEHLGNGCVTDVHASSLSTFTSTASRLEVTYSDEAPQGAPSPLFLKLANADSVSGVVTTDHLRKEVEFHRTVAVAMTDPPSITCYSAAYCPETGASYLLFDDVSETHFQTPHPLPPDVNLCELVMDCLARFHAFWWDHRRLGRDIGKFQTADEVRSSLPETEKTVRDFLDFLGDRLSTDRRRIYERAVASLPRLSQRHAQGKNLTLVHGDAHLWNFLYPHDPQKDRVLMIDWQFWHPSIGGTDLAFMIAREWYPERRSRLERPLIGRYYDRLVEHGVQGYAWDDCWNDYRLSVILVSIFIPVWQWSAPGTRPGTWWSGLERAMLAFDDLHCAELLPE